MRMRVEFGWVRFTGCGKPILFRHVPKHHPIWRDALYTRREVPEEFEYYSVRRGVVVRAWPSENEEDWPTVRSCLRVGSTPDTSLRCKPKDLLKVVRREHNRAMRELRARPKAH